MPRVRRSPRATLPVLGLTLLVHVATSARSEEVSILPDASATLEAARYVPSDPDRRLVGTVGGRIGLVRRTPVTLFIDARIETILGTERRETDANQGSYHIEFGVDTSLAGAHFTPFFHHVSRHALDRAKPEAVDWNVLGMRVDGAWPRAKPPRLLAGVGVGRATLASLVGYRWELTANAEVRSAPRASAELHCRSRARFVATEPNAIFQRRRFLDYTLELALRWTRAQRSLEAFVALEHRNDVQLTAPDTRTRLLLGLRFGLADSARSDTARAAPGRALPTGQRPEAH